MDELQVPEMLRASVSYLLVRATRAAAQGAAADFGGEPLRYPHYVTLAFVAANPGVHQRALSTELGTDPSDLVGVLDALVDGGLLERTVDPTDRRRRALTVTKAGHNWLRRRHRRAQAFDEELCRALPDGGARVRRDLTALGRSPGAHDRSGE